MNSRDDIVLQAEVDDHCDKLAVDNVRNTYFTFFQISKLRDIAFFWRDVSKSRLQKFSPQSFEMSSHTSLSDYCTLWVKKQNI